jgi:colanic acid biosynthesis protein WcaH
MTKPKPLSRQEFLSVVEKTPLVSIDLIVFDPEGKILVGLRKNRPAQNTWFVPGGIVFKDERIAEAIRRISKAELGVEFSPEMMHFKGVYEHLYPDNFAGTSGIGTHYILLTHEIHLTSLLPSLPPDQHSEYRWLTKEEILADPTVHANTKAYFSGKPTCK